MRIPPVVRILGMDYQVKITRDLKKDIEQFLSKKEKDKGDEYVGYFASECSTIFLWEYLPKQVLESTFLHEIFEAIDYQLSLKLKHDDTTRLGTAMYQILTENSLFDEEKYYEESRKKKAK